MSLIDLFLLLRDNFSGFKEKEIKTYAIRLISDNVLEPYEMQRRNGYETK